MEELVLSKRNVFGIIIVFLAFFGVFWVASSVVATEGGGQSDEEFSGCNLNDAWSIDTCVGAEWRYYETNSNRVVIKGKGDYAPGTTITGCGDVGGYWRYAMVAYKRSQYSDGTWYNPGDQVGITGMSGNSDSVFDSVYWNKDKDSYHLGAMYYYCPNCSAEERTNKMNRDFARIKTEYEAAQREWPNIFTKGFNKNSDLAWFCAENPNAAEYSSESKVSNSTTDNYTNNSYTTSSIKKASDSNRTAVKPNSVNVGDTLYITFAHNVYASRKVTKNVNWRVTRSVAIKDKAADSYSSDDTDGLYYKNYNDTRYTISTPANGKNSNNKKYSWNGLGGSISGSAKIEKSSGTTPGYMVDGGYGDSGSNSSYVVRDYYRLKFVKAGIYKFCETISVDGTSITSACSEITVKNVNITIDADCKQLGVPSTYGLKSGDNWYLKLMSGTSSLKSRARNVTTKPNEWTSVVYAKPGDKVEWVHCYYPGAQMVARMDATGLTINDPAGDDNHAAHSPDAVTRNKYEDFSQLWNRKKKSGASNWTNKFNINYNDEFTEHRLSALKNNNYPINTSNTDSYKVRKVKDTIFNTTKNSVTSLHVGEKFEEWAETGFPVTAEVINRARHCSDGPCYHSNAYLYGQLSDDSAFSEPAKLLVPYNFKNAVKVELKKDADGTAVIYAGEKASVNSVKAEVRTKLNSATSGTYATISKDAKIKMVVFLSSHGSDGEQMAPKDNQGSGKDYDICNALTQWTMNGDCRSIGEVDGLTLNPNGITKMGSDAGTVAWENNVKESLGVSSFSVSDVPAGTYYCLAAGVYPANSGSDTMMDTVGNNSWYISTPSCAKVAKKPSIQIWGAGLYTANEIALPYAKKFSVAGQNLTNNQSITFGSWVEQNIIARGKVTIASGAADGLASSVNNSKRTLNGLNGSYDDTDDATICILSPLTMPNYNCSGTIYPGSSSGSGSGSKPSSQGELIEQYKNGSGNGYESKELAVSDNICTLNSDNAVSLLNDGAKTYIYICKGNMRINGDIKYFDRSYSSLDDVPKIIIYAEKNIQIKCGVNQVDAVLIAEESVDTCYDLSGEENDNRRERSNPLRINGSIIADKLIARRTYGAGTGADSGTGGSFVPAEVVNYDSSLYLWNISMSEKNSSGGFEVDSQVELPPRL